jgi:hypothetical protein
MDYEPRQSNNKPRGPQSMYTNKAFNRLQKSRSDWKFRATEASGVARLASRRAGYHSTQHERLLHELISSRKENAQLRAALDRCAKTPVPTISNSVLQILCVQLVLNVHVSFRSVPRILASLCAILGFITRVPYYTTIIEWVLRIGLATIKTAGRVNEPWVGIMDFSIQCGKEKVLVILRVPLNHFRNNSRAPQLSDCETLSVSLRADWNQARIAEELDNIYEKCGKPAYWLTDGGSDLRAALRDHQPKEEPEIKPFGILDIGHFFANALRHMFEKHDAFKPFLEAIATCASQVRQTEFSHLSPPRLRSKGRFQSIQRLTDWFQGLREYITRQQRDADTTFQARLRKFFSWSEQFTVLVSTLATALDVSNRLQMLVKNNGLSQTTWPAVMTILSELAESHPFRIEVEPYLAECLKRSDHIGGIPLLLSDDVIETLFGVLKSFTGDGKNSNFGRMALIIPALTGIMDKSRIDKAFSDVKSQDLKDYIKVKIPNTLLRRRRSALRIGNIRKRRAGKKLVQAA